MPDENMLAFFLRNHMLLMCSLFSDVLEQTSKVPLLPCARERAADPSASLRIRFHLRRFHLVCKEVLPWRIDALARTGDYPEAQLLDYRRQEAIIYLKEALDDPQIDAVNLADGDIAKCFNIGSNFDEEDLARAQDAEMIARYQRVLHVSHPPRRYSLWSLVSCCSYLIVYVSDGIIVNRRVDSNLFPGLCSQSS